MLCIAPMNFQTNEILFMHYLVYIIVHMGKELESSHDPGMWRST
jgi:hypothetical protein